LAESEMTKALILAAGRGSRLLGKTDSQPKCLVKLGGHSLIRWQIAALREAGIDEISVVTGYRSEMLINFGLKTWHNPDWPTTNMVSSMLCADDFFDGPVIVSYSDIVYGADVVKSLAQSKAPLAVAHDTQWQELWKQRFEDPLDDAESFRLDANGLIKEIGRKVSDIDEIESQFIGLLKFTRESMGWVRGIVKAEEADAAKLDMTGLLSRLIDRGYSVQGIETSGNWCEIDSESDLSVAENMISKNCLVPDIADILEFVLRKDY
jgi:L-glutamine-phosphate cytidylyltransferase